MQSNRITQKVKVVNQPHDSTRVSSLKETALRCIGLAHSGFFAVSEDDYQALMVIKNNPDHELSNMVKTELDALLQHIAHGEQAEAKKMLDSSPHLLMLSGDVVDYSGRKIIGVTPLQLAFGGDDEVMCAMLKARLSKEEIAKQIDDKFPEDAEAEQKEIEDFTALMNQLAEAINDPNANISDELNHVANESTLRNVLDSFRAQFAPGEVRAGKHFNVQFLLIAFAIYDRNSFAPWGTNFRNWDTDRCQLFWSQVVGYLQRMLPVSYVQAVCQGIELVVKGVPLKRQLELFDKTTYFPLDGNPASRLGFDHGISIDWPFGKESAHSCAFRRRRCEGGGSPRFIFELYVEQKLQACRVMRPDRTSWCVTC